MQKYTRVGIDLGKNYFQIHALPRDGGVAANRKLRRSILEFCDKLKVARSAWKPAARRIIGRANFNGSDTRCR